MITEMPLTLSELSAGAAGWVFEFADEAIACRLLCMGVLPGSYVKMVRKAPFNGGVYLRIDGINVVMRNSEAKRIILTTTAPQQSISTPTKRRGVAIYDDQECTP